MKAGSKNWTAKNGDLLIAIFFLLSSALITISVSPTRVAPSKSSFVIPPVHIEKFSLGYNDTAADILWLRVIQDFDTCDHKIDVKAHEPCTNSWVASMLDRITDLSPEFRIVYVEGATDLDILLHDRPGASKLLIKGLRQFPHHWQLEYRAAYHFIFEDKDFPKAEELLISAYKDGGPDWLPALAGKLMSESGRGEMAVKMLTDLLETMPEGGARGRVEARLQKIKDKLASHESIDSDL